MVVEVDESKEELKQSGKRINLLEVESIEIAVFESPLVHSLKVIAYPGLSPATRRDFAIPERAKA